jgi:DNA-directed RNA polymerase specialized sigma24 family protein
VLAPAFPSVSLTHLPEDQAAAILLALRPGTNYREVAATLGVEPKVVLTWLREGLRSAAAPTRTPTPPSVRLH